MARWHFFTNHLHVLSILAEHPDLRLREIAERVGITERASHRIVTELVDEGYLTRTRVGSRNRYQITADAPLRHPINASTTIGQVITALSESPGSDNQVARSGQDQVQRPSPGHADMFGEVFAAAPTGIAVGDAGGQLLTVNAAFCELVGRDEAELLGCDFRDITHPDDIPADEQGISELITGQRAEYVREKRYLLPTGAVRWVKARVAATTHPDTGSRLFVAHVVDITQRRHQDQALAEAEERFRSAFANASIGMALVAPDGRFIKVNRSLRELTGYPETALLVRTFQDITHPDDLDADIDCVNDVLAGRRRTYQIEKRYYHARGHIIWVTLSVSLIRDEDGAPLYFISQLEDITDRKQREQDLQNQAAHLAILAGTDPLTGLSTRRAWDIAISEHMSRPQADTERLGVALIDLDGLKAGNDTLGHHAGDKALRATTAALRATLREEDLVARIGGDEFALLIPATTSEVMLTLTQRILASVPGPQRASAGIAIWDGHETAADLLARADHALYQAKRAGKGHAQVADDDPPTAPDQAFAASA